MVVKVAIGHLKALTENEAPCISAFELFNRLARAVTSNSSQKPEFGVICDAGDEGAGDLTFIKTSERS